MFAEVTVRRSIFLVVPLALAGCTTTHYVDAVPDSSWRVAQDSPRTAYPTTRRIDPARPSISTHSLSRDEVLAISQGKDPQDAIAEIDRHPLAFPLTAENIGWFEDRVAPPELVDYLRKRANVDWDALSSTPAQPPAQTYEYATPDTTEATPGDATPSYASADSTPSTSTTVYVQSAPPDSEYVYQYDTAPPAWWGGTVYLWGGCYYGCRPWRNHCYAGRYWGYPRTTYYGGYNTYYGGYNTYYGGYRTGTGYTRTYYPSTYRSTATTGSIAGLYPRTYSGGYSRTSVRTQSFARPSGVVRSGVPTVRSTRGGGGGWHGGGGGGWHGGGGHGGGHHR